ncbi:hypothetical protein ACFX13_036009 [Malus domestica]
MSNFASATSLDAPASPHKYPWAINFWMQSTAGSAIFNTPEPVALITGLRTDSEQASGTEKMLARRMVSLFNRSSSAPHFSRLNLMECDVANKMGLAQFSGEDGG